MCSVLFSCFIFVLFYYLEACFFSNDRKGEGGAVGGVTGARIRIYLCEREKKNPFSIREGKPVNLSQNL